MQSYSRWRIERSNNLRHFLLASRKQGTRQTIPWKSNREREETTGKIEIKVGRDRKKSEVIAGYNERL